MRFLEISLAALLPPLCLWLLCRRRGIDPALRAAATRWFIPLALLWFAPCWLTGRSLAPLDYLSEDIWPWVVPGFESGNPLLSDVPLQFLPWRDIVTDAYRHGQLPLLNRFAGSGSPLWENPQAAVLFPTTLLGLPFSTFAWPLFAAQIKLLLALIGTFLVARRFGASAEAAIFTAIAYSFGAFTIAFLLFPHTNVTVLLPWVLLGIDAAAESWRGAALFAIVLFLLFAGGHPESVLHTAMLAVPYGLGSARRHGPRQAGPRIVAAGLVGTLLAAPLLLPFLSILPHTERGARIRRAPQEITPPRPSPANLAPFVFAHALKGRRSPAAAENFNEAATQYVGMVTFLLALWAAARAPWRHRYWILALLVFGVLAFRGDLLRGVPVMNLTVHGRVRFLLAFVMALLAARGFDLVRSARLRRLLPFVLLLDLALLLATYHPPVDDRHFYPATPAIEFLQARANRGRLAGIENTLLPNTTAVLGLENIATHDPTAFEPYGALLERAGYDRRFYFSAWRDLPPKALLDSLGVLHVVAPPGSRSSRLPTVYSGPDATVFENASALPRFYDPSGAATVVVERYTRNGATIRVEAPRGVRIRSGEVALAGWSLTRDGSPWPLDREQILLSWLAPAGENRFELRYVPVGLETGFAMSAIGALLVLLMLVRLRHRS